MATSGASSNGDVVSVWEWQNEHGIWRAYSASICHLLDTSQGLTASVDIGVGAAKSQYKVDFNRYVQVRKNTGTERKVRRREFSGEHSIVRGVAWQWQGDRPLQQWFFYPIDAGETIEAAFLAGLATYDLSDLDPTQHYTIDLTRNLQINNKTKFERKIRRLQSDVKFPKTHHHKSSPSASVFAGIPMETDPGNPHTASSPGAASGGGGSPPGGNPSSPNTPQSNSSGTPSRQNSTKTATAQVTPVGLDEAPGAWNSALPRQPGAAAGASTATQLPPVTAAPINGGLVLAPACSVTSRHHPVISLPQPTVVGPRVAQGIAKQPFSDVTQKHMTTVNAPTDEECTICFSQLSETSGFDASCTDCVKLNICRHFFHRACMEAMYNTGTMDGSFTCPKCKAIHGVKTGNQPTGTMAFVAIGHSLPGFSECGSIKITYNMDEGIQGKEHLSPGSKYTARGFPRICYLPDNNQGRRVLRLLKIGWERRLIFTIGRSSTTAEDNTVIWNDIHHKTEFGSNTRGHGYPDPFYLDNVLSELHEHGITDT